MKPCACTSGQPFGACCRPFLRGEREPETAGRGDHRELLLSDAQARLNHGHTHHERIGPDAAGRTLLDHVARRLHTGRVEWRERIERGLVRLDGIPALPDAMLREGQELTWHRPPWVEPEVPLCAAVLYQDDELLAVAKPRGLPTLPAGGEFFEHTLLAVVHRRAPEAVPMHRLGRGTSGLLLFARTQAARRTVQEVFRDRRVHKVYRALCTGSPAQDHFRIDAPIGELAHPLLGRLHAASPAGKPSRSEVRVLERRPGCALVEVVIETGRPHQIRIHLAYAGHPLVGDPLYGAGGRPMTSVLARPSDLGYLLHSHRLTLPHPRTGEELLLECTPPKVLREGAQVLETPAQALPERSPK